MSLANRFKAAVSAAGVHGPAALIAKFSRGPTRVAAPTVPRFQEALSLSQKGIAYLKKPPPRSSNVVVRGLSTVATAVKNVFVTPTPAASPLTPAMIKAFDELSFVVEDYFEVKRNIKKYGVEALQGLETKSARLEKKFETAFQFKLMIIDWKNGTYAAEPRFLPILAAKKTKTASLKSRMLGVPPSTTPRNGK